MPRVDVEFLDGERVLFSARGRSFVNARQTLPDGPIGFSSGELLLIALANCSLGILTHHELLKDVPLQRCRATFEAATLTRPTRFDDIRVTIDLEVNDPTLIERQAALERAADHCPVGNTLRAAPKLTLELRVSVPTTGPTG